MGLADFLEKLADTVKSNTRTTALILAAGSGERFSKAAGALSGMKKQFVPILGVPVLKRTVMAFEECDAVSEIIIVTGEADIPYCRELLEGDVTKLTHIVAGGATRQESAMAGLEVVDPKSEYIAIHDGARCLITPEIIESIIDSAKKYGAAAAAESAVDTVKYADDDGVIENTIDRNHVRLMKTPQIFKANMYRVAVYSAYRDGAAVTDDCMLVERLGFKVKTVDCGHENIKITYPTDKIIAEAILSARQTQEGAE